MFQLCNTKNISCHLETSLYLIKDNTWTIAFATKFLISASCFFTHQRKEALNKQSTHFENIAFIACLKRVFFIIFQLAESTTRIRAFEAELDALMQYQVITEFYHVLNYKSFCTLGLAD